MCLLMRTRQPNDVIEKRFASATSTESRRRDTGINTARATSGARLPRVEGATLGLTPHAPQEKQSKVKREHQKTSEDEEKGTKTGGYKLVRGNYIEMSVSLANSCTLLQSR